MRGKARNRTHIVILGLWPFAPQTSLGTGPARRTTPSRIQIRGPRHLRRTRQLFSADYIGGVTLNRAGMAAGTADTPKSRSQCPELRSPGLLRIATPSAGKTVENGSTGRASAQCVE